MNYLAWVGRAITLCSLYLPIIVTPIGLIQNALLILVFKRKKFAKDNVAFYYVVSF